MPTGLAGYELNISCPNVKKGGMQFGCDPGHGFRGRERRPQGRRKAPPMGQALASRYRHWTYRLVSAAEAGADALTVANTYPAMAIDFRTGKIPFG